MKLRPQLLACTLAFALLAACNRGLPPSLERDVSLEADRLHTAEHQLQKSEAALNTNLAQSPDLFSGASEVTAWKNDISRAKANLSAAENDGRQLTALVERNRPDRHIPELLSDERKQRESALQKSQSVDQALAVWLDYKRDPAAFATEISRQRDQVRNFDLQPVSAAVHRAEQDWPAKKTVLETRLSSLTASATLPPIPAQATPSILIAEKNSLSQQATTLAAQSQDLQNASGQLYDSWDKILTDLDRPRFGPETFYRERLKVVRTHLIDVPTKKSETHSEEHWTTVSEAGFHAVENNIGMAIAHKDAGLFDSEAQNTPQPAGFSYVASPSVGSNQYGYWTHNGGESVWTFLPQYLILRELLWNHDYRPVMATEYNAYRVAQNRGATYFGRDTPTAAPKYGTHGTFTQSHYADSRYVQSGGFKGSAYSSGGATARSDGFNSPHSSPSLSGNGSDAGRRFGRQPGSPPSGQRFGHSPSPRPSGRSFGRRR